MSALPVVRAAEVGFSGAFEGAADLHIASIHHGVLPELGRRFLSRLYREIDRTPRAGLWIAIEGEQVVGFLAGCAEPRSCYRSVLWRAALPLAVMAAPALLRWSVLRRLTAILRYPFSRPKGGPKSSAVPVTTGVPAAAGVGPAELLAIAVDPRVRGRGVGSALVRAFEEGLRSWDVTGSYRVATNVEEEGSNRFYRNAGFEPAFRTAHNNLTLQVYVKQLAEGP